MPLDDLILRLAAALLLGVCIGVERQLRQRMAGLRTNTLVAAGAALFVIHSEMYPGEVSPTRIAAQVVSGIGFLGAGVIFKEGLSVRGLNTAATLWCSAAVGVLCGAGQIAPAAAGAAAVLAANMLLRPVAAVINRQPEDATEMDTHYRLSVTCREQDEESMRKLVLESLQEHALRVYRLASEDNDKPNTAYVHADLAVQGREDARLEQVLARLGVQPGVTAISWKTLQTNEEESHA